MPLARTTRVIPISPDSSRGMVQPGKYPGPLGRHTEALVSYDRAVSLSRYAEAWNNRETCARISVARKTRQNRILPHSLRPEYAEAWYNHGSALSDFNRHDEVVISYDVATARRVRRSVVQPRGCTGLLAGEGGSRCLA